MADGGDVLCDRKLEIWGRKLAVPECTENVARFSFLELCGKPLSAADYLEITKTFKTVFVEDVPRMGLDEKDMVSLFHRCADLRLVASSLSSTVGRHVFPANERACYESKVRRTEPRIN
jgi:predicted ATPase